MSCDVAGETRIPTELSAGDLSPELLAPAGNWECALAAVANGADAIYFGLDRFNARLRADNFTVADLPDLMKFLHAHGVKGFVTMNTLIFTDEMQAALSYLAELNDAGVDGVIVQDLGLAHLLTLWKREDSAVSLALHASTQMTLTSPGGIHFVERFLDLRRVVLARELSLTDIGNCATKADIPLEVFVHGALCVAYSGQCLTSESLGQRSANRGECAQACRMPYTLFVDGKSKPMGERRYLLSPQDLCAIDRIKDLVEMGVKSYKIEGRLKSPGYVAAVTAAYRKALDAAAKGIPVDDLVTEADRYALQMVFSRGFSTGWLDGANHPELTHGRHGKKRGALVGVVTESGDGWVDLALEGNIPLAPGDGFVFDAGEDRNEEQGGRIWKVQRNRLFFHGKASHVDWDRVRTGQKLWKTDDPILNTALQQSWKNMSAYAGTTIHLVCKGRQGEPLTVECPAYKVSVSSDQLLEHAEKRPLTDEVLVGQLGRLGGTEFSLGSCRNELVGDLMLPLSVLNKTRRALVEQLSLASEAIEPPAKISPYLQPSYKEAREYGHELIPEWSVLCRHLNQIEPALREGVKELYLDFEDIRLYADGVRLARSIASDVGVFLATPRIQKPQEEGFFKIIERAEPDGVLIRNLGAAEYFRESSLRKIADFSFNVANPHSAAILREQGGFERLTISYDLNARQVTDLLLRTPASWFELTLHQHMPMFHTEHCVFCAFLSEGTNYKNCGRPCETYKVELRDRAGHLHPLLADVGCRNTLFNGRAQTGATFFGDMRRLGLSRYRIELLHDTPEDIARLFTAYKELAEGKILPEDLIDTFNLEEQLGTTRAER
ncbi:MAG: DUF3656 domain-containing protein [Akkermansia sp.]